MSKIVNKISLAVIIILIGCVPVFFFLNHILGYASDHWYNILLWVTVPILLFTYLYKIFKDKVKIDKYDIFIYVFFFFLMLSTRFSCHIKVSTLGYPDRFEGLLSFMSYCLIFLNIKVLHNKDDYKKIIKVIFEIGIFQFVYSLFQVFFRFSFIKTFEISGVNYMAMGFIGNPNFLGSYCIMLLGLALMLYFVKSERKYFGLSIIFFINLILAQSTGPFFAFIILFIVMIVFMKIKGIIDWKKIGIVCASFILTFIIVSNGVELYCKKVFNDKIVSSYTIKGDILNTLNLFGVSKGNNEENITIEDYGSGRITIWKRSLKIVPKYFWLGSGLDTFGYVFPQKSGIFYDKAHNEYLQMLITTGIFTLLSYLIILFSLFIDGVKSNNKLVWVLMMPFIGYALQAFLNISVIFVAPTFYIIMGMMAGLISQEKVKEKIKKVA